MIESMLIQWGLLIAIACGLFAASVAGSKGHDYFSWLFGGFVFGPIALLAAVGLPDLKLRTALRQLAEHQAALSRESL